MKTTMHFLVALLCGTLCTLPATSARAQAPEPPAMGQVRAGDALMAQGRFAEAAQQFEAAYAIDPDIAILERLANAYQQAGDNQRAQLLYQRIAAERGGAQPPPPPYNPPPPGYNPPPPGYNPPPPSYISPSPLPGGPPYYTYARPRPRPGQQLLSSGLALLIAGYGIGIVGGAITMGGAYATNADSSWYGAGGMLFVPLAGPFATIAYNSNYWWAVPWAVIDGGMQLSGLALTIAGAVVRASHGHRADLTKPLPFVLAPYTTPGGGGLTLRANF